MDFPSNSVTPRSEKKETSEGREKIEPVIQGKVLRQKKPLKRKFTEVFVGGDARSVWSYVFMDVLVPAAKDMAADAVSQGIERMLFGEVRSSSRRGGRFSGPSNNYVNYTRYSSGTRRERDEPSRSISRRARASHDFDEIILATRVEAETVIDKMFDLLTRYDSVSVSDLYDLVGMTGDYTDEKWGWTDLRGAGVTRIRNGYLLDLPRPDAIGD